MTRLSRKKHRAAVYGWIKWSPALIAIFLAVFADIWLSVEARRIDYELGALNTEVSQLKRARDVIHVDTAGHQNVDHLTELAKQLGLRGAKPSQQINLKVYPEHNDTLIAMATPPVLDTPALDYGVKAAIVEGVSASPVAVATPVQPAHLDESPEAMLASLN